MKRTKLFLFIWTFLALSYGKAEINPIIGNEDATYHFTFDNCFSYFSDGTNMDYSEFQGEANSSASITIGLDGDNLYRLNPQENKHSCTPGMNGTKAMCVGYETSCQYDPGSDKAVRFDISVSTTSDEPTYLTNLNFFQNSPLMFDWIDGISGPNNYPTKYSVRVLRNNLVVFEEYDISTTNNWSEENFDFPYTDDFLIEDSAVFNFELLAYCPVGNSAAEAVWDLEDVVVTVGCPEGCDVNGGELAGGPFEFCVGDGEADMIGMGEIELSGNEGENSQWVVTDDMGNILGLPPSYEVVNFDDAPAGTCLVWHMSYSDGLEGLVMGNNVSDLMGCYSLSNSISVVRKGNEGGTLSTTDGELQNRVVVANRSSRTLAIINSDNNEVEYVDMPNEGQPMYAVYNHKKHVVLVGDYGGKVIEFDATDFSVLGEVSTGEGVFHMWLSPDNNQLWVNNELDKTISVVNANDLSILATIELPEELQDTYKPHDVIVMPNNEAAFVTFIGPDDLSDYVIKYDTDNFVETARAEVGNDPHVSLTDKNMYLYVASQGSSELQILMRSDLSMIETLSIPNAHGLGMSPSGEYLYVGNIAEGGLSASYTIDLSTNTIMGAPVDAPFTVPHNYAITSDNKRLYITHSGMNNMVSVYELSPEPMLIDSVYSGVNPFGLVAYSYFESSNEFEFCVGDGEADMIGMGEIDLSGNEGENSQWVVTDDMGNILGLPPSYEVVNFDDAPAGTCLVWHMSYSDGLEGLAMGNNVSDLLGCYSLSNSVSVVRKGNEGGELAGGPFEFCVGDGEADMIGMGEIDLSGNEGENSQWVVTDDMGNILGLPPSYEVVNFDDAPAGTCLVWHMSYSDGLEGLAMGNNVSDLLGCYSLSNSVSVVRKGNEGGELAGGPFEFCVGDGEADMIGMGEIDLSGNEGENSQWVVTDDMGNILGLPPSYEVVNFDDAPAGTCLVWHMSYSDGLEGLAMGNNVSDLLGCYSLSNSVSVVRKGNEGGELTGGPFEFCVGDGEADMIGMGEIDLSGNEGENSQWVVTDDMGNILGLPPSYEVVNFDDAPAGTCLVWHMSYSDGLEGLAMGNNVSDLLGCYSLSNSVSVVRKGNEGGELAGGPFEFCVGDGEADMIGMGEIDLSGNEGENSQWVVTDDMGNILGLPPSYEVVNFDDAPAGTCLVWHMSYSDGLEGLAMGNNVSDLLGCYSLSNSVSVVRKGNEGGELTGGPFEFCVGDGEADMIGMGEIDLSGNEGENSQWVVTDDMGNILGLPPSYEVVNFDDAPAGTCLVWHMSYSDGLEGLAMGNNVSDLLGCYSLSNSVSVVRKGNEGGELSGGPFEFCVGDGEADMIGMGEIDLSGNEGENSQWVVTDDMGNILGLPPSYEVVNFDDAPAGTCLVWHMSYSDGLEGLAMGNNVSDLLGCYSLSNSVSVVRKGNEGGELTGGPFEFCVGDGEADMIGMGEIDLSGNEGENSQWVVTDDMGNILGLPPSYEVVNFDDAPAGTCLVWHMSYSDGLEGLAMGNNVSDLLGCYSLSNSVSVVRKGNEGGELSGGPFEFCVGDGEADMIGMGEIDLSGNEGENSQWVVTDDMGNILGLPPSYEVVNFDDAPAGTCLVWHMSYSDGLEGLAMGNNVSDLLGCYSLSNSVSVVRENCNGFTISADLEVMAYPNPTYEMLKVEILSAPEKYSSITVINSFGQEVESINMIENEMTAEHNFNMGRFADGIYFIRIRSGEKVRTIRVSKI